LSLRGAFEANGLLDSLKSDDTQEKLDAEQTLAAAAGKLGVGADELRNTLGEVAYDPYTLFLVRIWPDADETGESAVQ
jgi:hypothetical protein